ncbi:flagellar brake protein [Pseudoduganella sp. RAF53_2]|uniref:flagellar brake protein n=1 Tax=unclassified Pseudoduganella TaxID=2637179 RepID=UPI003F9A0006
MNDPMPTYTRKGPPRLSDAVEPMSGGVQPHDITNPDDIADALAMLATRGDAISIYPDSSVDPVMARILSVDPELPHFIIELNEGGALPPGACTFVCWLNNAKFQFRLNDPHWNALPEQPTLIPAQFPERCQVQNRRGAPRMETPLGVYYTASFVLNGKPYELQLYDFAIGGVGMRCSPREAVGLHVGRKLQRVRLELGPETVVICDLDIRLVRHYRSFLLGDQVQIGCQFMNMPPNTQEDLRKALDRLNTARVTR